MHTGDINNNPINHSMQSSSGRYSQQCASKLNKDFDSPGSSNAGQVDSLLLTDATSPLYFSPSISPTPGSLTICKFRFRISCCLQLLSELTLRNLALVFISTPDFAAHTGRLWRFLLKNKTRAAVVGFAQQNSFLHEGAGGSSQEVEESRGVPRSGSFLGGGLPQTAPHSRASIS